MVMITQISCKSTVYIFKKLELYVLNTRRVVNNHLHDAVGIRGILHYIAIWMLITWCFIPKDSKVTEVLVQPTYTPGAFSRE